MTGAERASALDTKVPNSNQNTKKEAAHVTNSRPGSYLISLQKFV